MGEAFVGSCPETTCGFSVLSPDRAEAVEDLLQHVRDQHGPMEREHAERLVVRAPPPTPGTPARQLR